MMKRLLAAWLCILLLMMGISGAVADDVIRVFALKGPTGIGMVKLMNDNDGAYVFTLGGSPDEAVAAVASGQADIAAVPTNMAAVLYKKTNKNVQLLALNTLGVLSIVTTRNDVTTIEDLAGKTIYATGQGAVPEYVLNYILKAHGIADQVTVQYKAEHSELATLVAADKVDLAMLPEPFVTSVMLQNQNVKLAMDVTELFQHAAELNGASDIVLSMGCLLVNKGYAENHRDQLEAFLKAYEVSVAFVNEDPAAAGIMVEDQGILPKAAIAAKAIPNCHLVCVTGEKMKTQIQPFYQLLLGANPASVGGALPEDDFYYMP